MVRKLAGLLVAVTIASSVVAASEAPVAAAATTISLRAGWNPVGLQVQQVTSLEASPALVGLVTWNAAPTSRAPSAFRS